MQLAKENNIPFAVALNVIASALKSKGLTLPLAFVAKLFRMASELVLSSSLSMVSVTIEVIPYLDIFSNSRLWFFYACIFS